MLFPLQFHIGICHTNLPCGRGKRWCVVAAAALLPVAYSCHWRLEFWSKLIVLCHPAHEFLFVRWLCFRPVYLNSTATSNQWTKWYFFKFHVTFVKVSVLSPRIMLCGSGTQSKNSARFEWCCCWSVHTWLASAARSFVVVLWCIHKIKLHALFC